MNEEQWIERALIAEQKLSNVEAISKRLHDGYSRNTEDLLSDRLDDLAHELDGAMAFNPLQPIDWDFLQYMESTKCGYIVPDGHTYCRNCGGGGGDEYGNECVVCSANGSHQHPSWAAHATREN